MIKEGWRITADPYVIQFGGVDQDSDLAAEKLIGAERGDQRIAVAVKSFTKPSMVTEFHAALGQFLHYRMVLDKEDPDRMVLDKEDPDRMLYLVMPIDAFETFFGLRFTQTTVQRHGVHLIVYDPGGFGPMDKAARHGELIQENLREYSACKPSYGEVEVETIFLPGQGHYQLRSIGRHGQHRIHGCLLHVDIRNGKVWIQHEGAEEGIANRLVAAGVPKEDIVLAFQSPFKRKFTEFAVG